MDVVMMLGVVMDAVMMAGVMDAVMMGDVAVMVVAAVLPLRMLISHARFARFMVTQLVIVGGGMMMMMMTVMMIHMMISAPMLPHMELIPIGMLILEPPTTLLEN